MDLELEADQVTDVTLLAAAAVACMAAIGNGDATAVDGILRSVVVNYERLSPDARGAVQTVADELVDCALTGKTLVAVGNVQVSDQKAKRN